MTILVIGSSGQLGKTFRDHLGSENTFYLDRKKCDLSDKKSLKDSLDELKPSRIINCAAYTNVDKAETEKDLAFEVNGYAVGIISEWVKKHDSELIHFSTDYVFDGDQSTPYLEGDKPNPLSTYGKSKLLGEQLFLDSGARGVCLRTSWVHSNYGQNFLPYNAKVNEREKRN